MPEWVPQVIAIVTSVLASSGMWTYVANRKGNKDARLNLLLGLAHDRIIYIGKSYIRRGWISYDEYEDFMKYLYDPYAKFGGNGLAEKVQQEVSKLPIKSNYKESGGAHDSKTLP